MRSIAIALGLTISGCALPPTYYDCVQASCANFDQVQAICKARAGAAARAEGHIYDEAEFEACMAVAGWVEASAPRPPAPAVPARSFSPDQIALVVETLKLVRAECAPLEAAEPGACLRTLEGAIAHAQAVQVKAEGTQ